MIPTVRLCISCLERAFLLLGMICSLPAFSQEKLDDNTIKSICGQVLEMTNSGALEKNLVKAFTQPTPDEEEVWGKSKDDYAGTALHAVHRFSYRGRTRVIGSVVGGGTCSTCALVDIHATAEAVLPEDDDEEHLRWADWGNCDSLIFLGGEPIVVTGKLGWNVSSVSLVSWIAPDGANHPLCYLERTKQYKLENVMPNAHEICRTATTQFAKYKTWDANSTMRVDIDMNGTAETLALQSYESGGGCGSTKQWLTAFDKHGREISEGGLSALLRKQGGPVEPRSANGEYELWQNIRVLVSEGKPYVVGRGEGKANMTVISLWNKQEKQWCAYRVLPTHKILRYYPVETKNLSVNK